MNPGLSRLEKLPAETVMKFNKGKCKALQLITDKHLAPVVSGLENSFAENGLRTLGAKLNMTYNLLLY